MFARGNSYSPSAWQNDFGIGYWNGTAWIAPLSIDSGTGNVGIGSTLPTSKLEVAGDIRNATAVSNTAGPIDFSTGNLQFTTNSCGAFALHNLKSGGVYTFAVKGLTAATCVFTGYSDAGVTAISVHVPPDHGPTAAGSHTVYSFTVMGTDVYVSWVTGY